MRGNHNDCRLRNRLGVNLSGGQALLLWRPSDRPNRCPEKARTGSGAGNPAEVSRVGGSLQDAVDDCRPTGCTPAFAQCEGAESAPIHTIPAPSELGPAAVDIEFGLRQRHHYNALSWCGERTAL